MIRVSDNDGASVAVRGAEERHPSRVVERLASNERVLVGQLEIPAAGGVAINRYYQGNICSHKDSIQPPHGSRISTDRARRTVEDHTPPRVRRRQRVQLLLDSLMLAACEFNAPVVGPRATV